MYTMVVEASVQGWVIWRMSNTGSAAVGEIKGRWPGKSIPRSFSAILRHRAGSVLLAHGTLGNAKETSIVGLKKKHK